MTEAMETQAETEAEILDDSVSNATIAQRVLGVIGFEKELSDLFAGAAHVTSERFDDFLETVNWEKFNP